MTSIQKFMFILGMMVVPGLAGCAGGFNNARYVEPPIVRLADISFENAGLFEQRVLLTLRVQNPNDFALPIEGMRVALAVNDRPFADGVTGERVTIPRLGEEYVEIAATTTVFDIVDQFMQLASYRGLDYRMTGTAWLGRDRERAVPFDQEGAFRLGPRRGLFESAD